MELHPWTLRNDDTGFNAKLAWDMVQKYKESELDNIVHKIWKKCKKGFTELYFCDVSEKTKADLKELGFMLSEWGDHSTKVSWKR
jgi:hypothetical protein